MASMIFKFLAKKVLKESVKNRFGKEDPDFKLGTSKKKGRTPLGETPPTPGLEALSKHDAEVLRKARRRAYIIDEGIPFLGTRIGVGAVFGLFPVAGDTIDFLLAVMVISTCNKIEGHLPFNILFVMFVRAVVDWIVGIIPFLGDILDAYYKANKKNVNTLEEYLQKRGDQILRRQEKLSGGAVNGQVRPDGRATEGQVPTNPPSYTSTPADPTAPRQPQPAKVAQKPRKSNGGWFGRSDRAADVERGEGPGPGPDATADIPRQKQSRRR